MVVAKHPFLRFAFASLLAWALLPAPAMGLADVVVHVLTLQEAKEIRIVLVGPDGKTWKGRGGSGPVTLVPEGEPGDYELEITVDGEAVHKTLQLSSSGQAIVTYRATALGTQVYVNYAEAVPAAPEEGKKDAGDKLRPDASTEVSSAQADSRLIGSLDTLDDFVAGLEVARTFGFRGVPGEAAVTLRGAGRPDASLLVDSPVAVYLDGVPLPRAQGAVLDLVLRDTVEVLPGPQGTSFGASAPGGAIRLVTSPPDAQFDVWLDGKVGSDGLVDATLGADAPLGGTIYAGLTLTSTRRDGLTESLVTGERFDDEHREAGRFQLEWDASQRTTVHFAADGTRQRQKALNQTLLALRPTPLLDVYNQALAEAGLDVYDERWIAPSLFQSYSDAESRSDTDLWGLRTSFALQEESWLVETISAYRETNVGGINDDDGSPVDLESRPFELAQEQLSQEVRLSGPAGRLRWLVGAFYLREKAAEESRHLVLGEGFLTLLDTETKSRAVFGEISWEAADRLTVTAGLRAGFDDRQVGHASEALSRREESDTWSHLAPRLAVAYQAGKGTTVYGSVAQGFLAGGFSVVDGELRPYEDEEVLTWEAGFRASLGRVKLHGTAYLNDWTDLQVSFPANLTGPYFATLNVGSAEALGAELELEASLHRGFLVTAGGSWIDTDLLGASFPRTPEWSFHVSPRYSFTLASSSRFTVGADWSYRGDVYLDVLNSPQIAQKAFGLLNARVSYTAPSEFWSVDLYGTNLTDEEYLEAAYVSPFGAAIGTAGRPLVLGVKFRIIYTQQ